MFVMTVSRTTHSIMYVGSKHFDSRWKRARLFSLQFSERVARVGFLLHQRIARTLVGQEHAPIETSRPLSTGPDPCGRLQSFGAARLCYDSHWLLGPRCSATDTSRGYSRRALLALGSRWVLMYSLSSANTIFQQKITARYYYFRLGIKILITQTETAILAQILCAWRHDRRLTEFNTTTCGLQCK